jgi:hypothetical protein
LSPVYSALWPIQQAFAAVLIADTTLVGLLAKDASDTTGQRPAIFGGDVTENQATPFLILGDTNSEIAVNAFSGGGWSDDFNVHVWSAAHTPRELYDILSSLNRLLHKQSLPLSGGLTVLHCFLAPRGAQGPIPDPDGISKHLIVPYHIYAG